MGKTETLKKQKKSKRKSLTVHVPFSSPVLKNKQLTIEILLECIKEGDADTFRETLYAYLRATNKMDFAEKAGIGRRTLYDLLDHSKEFNPGFLTLSALFHALEAA